VVWITCSSQIWFRPSGWAADVPPGSEGEAKAKGAKIGRVLVDVLMTVKGTLL